MSLPVRVEIHPTQFPEAVMRDLLESLRQRRVNHKFHYDSIKQTQKWLALHRAYSPSRTDVDCSAIYDRSFDHLAKVVDSGAKHLIGLGCGGGQKDARLIQRLVSRDIEVDYTPMDVSVAMVLVARNEALRVLEAGRCHPFVADLGVAENLYGDFDPERKFGASRVYTFFGMIPNFEPQMILPKLAELLKPGDHLLFSANLAPGDDYGLGVQRVLPLYDNELTKQWLVTFLHDLGVEKDEGEIRFSIEDDLAGSGLKKIVARYFFKKRVKIVFEHETFYFMENVPIQLFFSYRHTPASIRRLLAEQGMHVEAEWVTQSGEEGVFYCMRS